MYNVTVLFTRHNAIGMCNSDELLKLIQSVQPDVIFEEIGYEVYDQIYNQQSRTTLESNAIKIYLFINRVEHIPVDTFDRPDSYRNSWNQLSDVFESYFQKPGQLKDAINQQISQVSVGGFRFLNSDQHDAMMDTLEAEENSILAELADDNLNQLAQLRNEVNSKRDEVMIDNIYRLASEQSFQKGIFLIGAGHRRSIKNKLDKIAPRYDVKINWHFLSS